MCPRPTHQEEQHAPKHASETLESLAQSLVFFFQAVTVGKDLVIGYFSLFIIILSLMFSLLVVFQVFHWHCKSVTEVERSHSWLNLALLRLLADETLWSPQKSFYATNSWYFFHERIISFPYQKIIKKIHMIDICYPIEKLIHAGHISVSMILQIYVLK